MTESIQLFPAAPNIIGFLFKSEQEYQDFRERYIAEVAPRLRQFDLQRARSEQHSFFRVV